MKKFEKSRLCIPFLIFFSLLEAMDTTSINQSCKIKAPIASKTLMHSTGSVIDKNIELERPESPTLSPTTLPRKNDKRLSSPLGLNSSKNIPNQAQKEMLNTTKKGNLSSLKIQLDVYKTECLEEVLGKILHKAIEKNQFNIVRYILENKNDFDINYSNKKNKTPLLRATKNGSFAIINHLLFYGADVNAKTRKGNTPLHLSAKFGHVEAIKLLLKRKKQINIDAENIEQKTPLYLAVEHAQLHAFNLLKKHKADVGIIDHHQRNLLHAAVASGYLPILCNLLETTNLDVNDHDDNNKTPLDLAQNNGDEAVVKTLQWYSDKRS